MILRYLINTIVKTLDVMIIRVILTVWYYKRKYFGFSYLSSISFQVSVWFSWPVFIRMNRMMIVEPLVQTTFLPVDIQSLDLSSIWLLKTWPSMTFKATGLFHWSGSTQNFYHECFETDGRFCFGPRPVSSCVYLTH